MARPGYQVAQLPNGIHIAYREQCPSSAEQTKGTVILIHGFPQTSYQFRHTLPLLAAKGYRCIAPDYRGAGFSSKPELGFDKVTMGNDIALLLESLGIISPVHLVGHDIGGMIAFTLAHHHPEIVKSVCWGECPLPGTQTYYRDRREPERQVQQFHFIFHCVPGLAKGLIEGKERMYVTHFLEKIASSGQVFSEADVDHYVTAYSQPGAMRCALGVYAAFGEVSGLSYCLAKDPKAAYARKYDLT